MHLRRALLLMALVVFLVSVVAALAPQSRDRGTGAGGDLPPAPVASPPVRTIELRFPARGEARRVRVATGAHVVLEVATTQSGEASVPALGLVQPAETTTPAQFDVLAERPGSYDVSFDPAAGEPAVVGRLVVARPG
jgi:hypothetical protein